ncbi:hypothetical protein L6654_27900, partial [Bradyrhizobium sp. WYCCWR 13023]
CLGAFWTPVSSACGASLSPASKNLHRSRHLGASSLIIVFGNIWQFLETSAHRRVIAIKVELGVLGEYLFRSNDGSYFIGRVKVNDMQLLAIAFPGDFVHLHAGLKLESHNLPLKSHARPDTTSQMGHKQKVLIALKHFRQGTYLTLRFIHSSSSTGEAVAPSPPADLTSSLFLAAYFCEE